MILRKALPRFLYPLYLGTSVQWCGWTWDHLHNSHAFNTVPRPDMKVLDQEQIILWARRLRLKAGVELETKISCIIRCTGPSLPCWLCSLSYHSLKLSGYKLSWSRNPLFLNNLTAGYCLFSTIIQEMWVVQAAKRQEPWDFTAIRPPSHDEQYVSFSRCCAAEGHHSQWPRWLNTTLDLYRTLCGSGSKVEEFGPESLMKIA